MNELRKLVFEKIKFDKLKMSKSDYVALVEKGQERGIEETHIKKLVSSCLKNLKAFKGKTLPLSILEEKNVELEAEELYIPADVLKAWREEAEIKLKELEKILALNNQEELQSFLSQNPEMEAVSKVPLSQFVKTLHKNIESTLQQTEPESQITEEPSEDEAEKEESPETEPQTTESAPVEKSDTAAPVDKKVSNAKAKKLPILLIASAAAGFAFVALIVAVIIAIVLSQPKVEDFLNETLQYQTFIDSRDNQQYYTMQVGDQEWIAQNMNYATENSLCDTCKLYGRLYTYDEALSACPAGYSIPTKNDVDLLISRIGDASKLISQKMGGSDEYGFSSIMTGFFSAQDHIVKRRGEILGFWLYDETKALALRAKIEKGNAIDVAPLKKDYGFSVRCIKSVTSVRNESAKLLIDNRDRKIYQTSLIGNRRWMNQNLNYRVKNSYCYNDDTTSCNQVGRLYDFETAGKVCPEGWRLPDSSDVVQLDKWIPQYGGFRDAKGVYALAGERADFWTTAEQKKRGVYWYIQSGTAGVNFSAFSKEAAMSVRCVELSEEELEEIQAEIDRAALEAADREEIERRRLAEEAALAEKSDNAAEEERRAELERRAEEERAEMKRRAEEERAERERRAEEERAEMERRAEEERAAQESAAMQSENEETGVLKIASVKSLSVQYDGYESIFSAEDVNAYLRKNKAAVLAIYRRLLSSRSEFETTIKFRLTVDLDNGKVLDVEDISKESNLSEDGHLLLFKQVSTVMRSRWRLLPQNISGTAIVEFPLRFQLQ